jgi:Polyketide cyclase / dehydrase and lipid transport
MPPSEDLHTVRASIPRPAEECWRALTDPTLLSAWLPGLRRATVIARDANDLATEVQFEFAASRSYSLLYTYNHEEYEMRWEPRMGKRDAVRGYARIEIDPAYSDQLHSLMFYSLEQGEARTGAELELGDPGAIVAAFATWITARSRRA